MTHDVRELADTVLHEGYLLYPYSDSTLKNLHRFPFGTLYPERFCRAQDAGDAWYERLECVATGGPEASISVEARFLQMPDSRGVVRSASPGSAELAALAREPRSVAFEFAPVSAELVVAAARVDDLHWKVSVELRNTTRNDATERLSRDEAFAYALVSAHLLLEIQKGEFVSSIDPPSSARALVESCRSEVVWPVLVGAPGSHDRLLAAPIILYDYPELAPESPGDFFDGTEIDELLTLRVLTLTDEEKEAMLRGDPRARALLERTEAAGLPALGNLHGALRPRPGLRPGARVRLRPQARGDIFDLALAGKAATVQAVERDFEGRLHVAVTVDDDPGKDQGPYGHRFFFKPEEVELL